MAQCLPQDSDILEQRDGFLAFPSGGSKATESLSSLKKVERG